MKFISGLFFKSVIAICSLLLMTTDIFAQCAACRMGLESNLKNGGTTGSGINLGILYLLSTPYLIVGGIAYVWWRNKKKVEEHNLLEGFSEN